MTGYLYDAAFQTMAATGSAEAARRIIAAVRTILTVTSVVDIGCARGTWLRQWQAQGVNDVTGVDGAYVDLNRLEIDPACFVVHDLVAPFALGRRFDLVESLEVAEHLPPHRAASFVSDLVAHGDAVLFSAAPPGQGGENHLNEQPAHFWQDLFLRHDYVAIDCLRPLLARAPDIPAWYRYNIVLFIRRGRLDPIAPFARCFQLRDGEALPDVSPALYRIRKQIVRSLPKRLCDALARWNARRFADKQAKCDDLARGSPERFGYSWDIYNAVLPAHEEQFLRWTGQDKSFWHGTWFLDAGCGIGRNAYWPMQYGARGGAAIDVDDRTLRAATANLVAHPSVEVRKQSIYDISEVAAFDIAFSIGVVHHLSDPDAAVARMVRAVKPGGTVLVWLYGRENNGWIVRFFNPLRRGLFSRMPLRVVHALSLPLTAILWSMLRLGLPSGPYYRLLRGFSFAHLQAIVFDHMVPTIARYYRREEAEALLRRAGLSDIRSTWVNQNSWSVTGRKIATTAVP